MDSLGYFGLSLQVGDFGLDIYLTQLVFGIVEVPARYSSIFTMQWLGRKWSQMLTLVLGGLMCIAIIFVPAGTRSDSPTPLPLTPQLPEARGFPFRSEGSPGVEVQKAVWEDRAGAGSGSRVWAGSGSTVWGWLPAHG